MAEKFFKYHGLGNDFVILDRRASGADIDAPTARWICDRRRGVGADGALVVTNSARASARMIVHNADGSSAETCGNGIRCVAKYLVDHQREKPERLKIETDSGVVECRITYRDGVAEEVEASMGQAKLIDSQLPSARTGAPFVNQELPGHPGVSGTAVSMGNPHLVLFVQSLEESKSLGPRLEQHPIFPQNTNVEFVQQSGSALKVSVWERGAGLTEACGTGACAAAVAAVTLGRITPGQWVDVELPGGTLRIWVDPELKTVQMRGPASFVYEGSL
jgi:diaminopimelate epimerase